MEVAPEDPHVWSALLHLLQSPAHGALDAVLRHLVDALRAKKKRKWSWDVCVCLLVASSGAQAQALTTETSAAFWCVMSFGNFFSIATMSIVPVLETRAEALRESEKELLAQERKKERERERESVCVCVCVVATGGHGCDKTFL